MKQWKKWTIMFGTVFCPMFLCACVLNYSPKNNSQTVTISPVVTQTEPMKLTPITTGITDQPSTVPSKETPTVLPSPTEAAVTVTPKITQSVTPGLTEAVINVSPTMSPVSIAPSPTPVEESSVTPKPSTIITPVVNPQVTVSPIPTVLPTKIPADQDDVEIDSSDYVGKGWQSMLDITMKYQVVFPDCFNLCEKKKQDLTLSFIYRSSTDDHITLKIEYCIDQTLESAEEKLRLRNAVYEVSEDKRRVKYTIDGENMFSGVAYENFYSAAFLGNDIFSGNGATGMMWVEVSYPKSMQQKYELDQYRVLVIPTR